MDARGTLAELARRVPGRLQRIVPLPVRNDLRRRLGRHHPWEEGFDFTPPDPAGLGVGAPDFVGVGASLCGTEWWYRLIIDHPEVAADRIRPIGLHYFSHFGLRRLTDADIERYHQWFPRPVGASSGEWTPDYAAQPWVAPLLARAAPEARLLFLVRDPVERFRLGMARTIEARVSNEGATAADVVDGGFYAIKLRRLLAVLPSERILVLQLERCISDTDSQLAETYRFLGLDDSFRPPHRPSPVVSPLPALDPSVTERLADIYADDVVDLARLVPDLDLERWPWIGGRGGNGGGDRGEGRDSPD
jgi:hypothetical protein